MCSSPIDKSTSIRPAASRTLACQEGFEYWLDVIDPTLTGTSAVASSDQSAAAVAAVIEMALLNSTHVIAAITPNTKGSLWVPYEYGRVKTPDAVSLQAACWTAPSVTGGLPEYLHLGAILKSELEIKQWLKSELQKHPERGRAPCQWSGPTPLPL